FRKTLLHVQSPRVRELDSKLRCYSKSGGRRGIEVADVAKVLRRRWDCGLRTDCAVGCADILDLASAKRSRNQKQEKSRSHAANA
ncbi:hypothetical protein XaclCFBP3371_13770, partial [Xanthomonas euvesicatoria pv. citrumelonis]